MTKRRVSSADLSTALEFLISAAGSLGVRPPAGHSWSLQNGSATNGIAYRVMYRDDKSGGLAHCPLFSGGYVGMTKHDAWEKITTVTYALNGVSIEQDKSDELSAADHHAEFYPCDVPAPRP